MQAGELGIAVMSDSGSRRRSVLAVCFDISEVFAESDVRRDGGGFSIASAPPDEALQTLRRRGRTDLVLVADVPGREGTDSLIRRLVRAFPHVSTVAVAPKPSVKRAVSAIRMGAVDYVHGPLDEETLQRIITGGREESVHDSHRRYFCGECPPGVEFVGRSPAAVEALRTIRLVASSRCEPVLILGESGAGKELAAKAIHWWRFGDFGDFVAVNCATLKTNLLESELFGHVKGAFTGAEKDRDGLLARAAGGSIFLDEIAEMSPCLQAKLLRVIQEKSYRKVGGTEEIPCQARIIASTNRVLLEAVEKGHFRHDLYYRLAVFPIVIPPLRNPGRREDISLLADYFLEQSAGPDSGIDRHARRILTDYDWPGNVRELRNVIERAAIMSRGEDIRPEHVILDRQVVREPLATTSVRSTDVDMGENFSLEAAERELIIRALQETDGKRTRAAALLGITRATLHAKLKRYRINIPSSHNRQSTPESASK